MENIDGICKDLVKWIENKVKEAGAKGVVLGLSGGIDSAVVAGLAKQAFPDNSVGIMMPCHSNPIDEEHGKLVGQALDLKTIKIDLTDSFDLLLESMPGEKENKLAISNLKPRLRMTSLYYYAQSNNYLVLGPTNKSEFKVGYFTKHGDSGVDLLPIASFVKREIRELARHLNIPDIIIDKVPTAGLWENQTDEDEMGFSYQVLDDYIETGQACEKIANKIDQMDMRSQHKRQYPPMYIRE